MHKVSPLLLTILHKGLWEHACPSGMRIIRQKTAEMGIIPQFRPQRQIAVGQKATKKALLVESLFRESEA